PPKRNPRRHPTPAAREPVQPATDGCEASGSGRCKPPASLFVPDAVMRVSPGEPEAVSIPAAGPVNGFCFYVKNSAVVELNLWSTARYKPSPRWASPQVKRTPSPDRPGI